MSSSSAVTLPARAAGLRLRHAAVHPRPPLPALCHRGCQSARTSSVATPTAPVLTVRRRFSTIQRGHDKAVESLFDKLGFGKDKEAHRVRRTLKELEQGFVREVQRLADPVNDPKDAARLQELKEAYVLLRDDNFRRNYAAHYYNSSDAQLHVLVDGGAVAANFNPEHQSFEYLDHSVLKGREGESQQSSLSGGASTSFASTQEAYRSATGTSSSTTTAAASAAESRAYSAATARSPQNGADIPFLLKLRFEESVLGCSRQLQVSKHTTCTACNGDGTRGWGGGKAAARRNCPQCLGRGSVHLPSATYHIERKCNHCGGEGTMPPPRCTRCRGRGVLLDQPHTVAIQVPAGAFTGAVFRLQGHGHDGVRGGRAGSLVVTIVATEHRHFFRRGTALHAMLPLPLTTALLGGVVAVPSLGSGRHGKKPATTQLRVPPCVRNGQVLSLRQHGVSGAPSPSTSSSSSSGEGGAEMAVYYHVLVMVPSAEKLTGRQKAALTAYEAAARDGDGAAAEHSETAEGADAVAARRDGCAAMKEQYAHWFNE